jgi:nitrite reductase/ring-hydroxylating ferredoxin subunit
MAGQKMSRTGEPNGLPASILALGEGLREADDIAPSPALFEDAEVFAAERARIFPRGWIIADHVSRLPADGRYCVLDTGARSLLLTREGADRLHALGNICIHAGYPVCEDDGEGERLHCPYHDWAYALDGRLVYPALSPERYDPARLRLKSYPLTICRGLILVDLSGSATPPDPDIAAALPFWLAEAVVSERVRIPVERNWKHLHEALWSSPQTLIGCPPSAPILSFGPLSLLASAPDCAVILRLVPKSSGRTDLQLIRLAAAEAENAYRPDGVAEAIAAAPPPRLDRRFFEWYWPLVA